MIQSIADIGQESQMSCTLDGGGQLTLMPGAGAGNTAGNNLSAVGKISAQAEGILIIDILNLINAESADFLSAFAAAARSAVAVISIESHYSFNSFTVCFVKYAQNGRSSSSSIA